MTPLVYLLISLWTNLRTQAILKEPRDILPKSKKLYYIYIYKTNLGLDHFELHINVTNHRFGKLVENDALSPLPFIPA